jgi:hypothetical protein
MLSKGFAGPTEIFPRLGVLISFVALMTDLDTRLRWMKAINGGYGMSGHYWRVNESGIILQRLAAKCITEVHWEGYRFIVCSEMTTGIKVIHDLAAGNTNQDVVDDIDDTTMIIKKVVGKSICRRGG